jgi:TonB family protein
VRSNAFWSARILYVAITAMVIAAPIQGHAAKASLDSDDDPCNDSMTAQQLCAQDITAPQFDKILRLPYSNGEWPPFDGTVVTEVLVGSDGRCQEVRIIKRARPPQLNRAAELMCKKRYTWHPALKEGVPVPYWIPMEFKFGTTASPP